MSRIASQVSFYDGQAWNSILNLVYPVNSIYITANSTSPATLFGGTWAQQKNGLIACAGTSGFASAGNTAGSTTISVNQMPAHTHSWIGWNYFSVTAASQGYGCLLKTGTDPAGNTKSTGGGAAFYPKHVSFNVWKRTA